MEGIPLFNPTDFKKIKIIGSGSFGTVYLVENIKTHNKYAVKEPNNPKDNFEKEIQTYKKVNNAAVLSLLGYSTKKFKSGDKLLLYTDYMSNGSLDDFLKKHKKSEKKTKYIILLGVALGMKYLHWQGIIHRDLKPENVLLNDKIEPKICDFGESEVSDKEFTDILMESKKGSPLYMAPEIFDCEHPYNYKVDVYAFSFFAYELITGKSPFEEKHFKNKYQLCKAVKAGERPDLSVIKDSYIKEFLEKCWSQRPSDRPSFLEIVDELMNDKFKEFFGINNKEDIEKVDQYLQLFDDDLKSPNSKDALDWKKKADEGDIIAILQYAHMLYIGYGALMNKEEAVKYWMKAADLGSSLAMYQIAYCLRHGFGIEKNIDESIRYYKMAAEKGYSVAMINLGHMYFKGDEIQADSNEAFKYYTLAAKYGNVNALINIGNMFYYGRGKPENKKLGLQFYKKAADLGSEQAMFIYGKLLIGDSIINNESITESKFNEAMNYLKMSAEKGYVDAMAEYAINRILKEGYNFNDPEIIRYLKLGADHGNDYCKKLLLTNKENDISIFLGQSDQELKELADAGDVQAMVSYAKMLYSREDETQDKEEASKYFKMAADLGDPHAMFEYGKMLVNGDGIPEKKKEGIEYLTSSVISRNIEVMYLYGQLRRKGEGISVDIDEASRYIKLSADRGYEPALFAYGQMLLRGEGVPTNKEKGIKYIEESTFLNGEMMYEYGEMLRKGEDVAVDKKKAAEYFRKASELEEPRAILSYGSMKYFGEGIPVNKKDGIRLIKLASDKGLIEAKELFEKLTGKNSENKDDILSIIDSNENDNDNETNDSSTIKVNIYKPTTDNGAKNFMYLKHTIPQQIRDEFENEIKKYDFFNGIQRNLVHPDDPNTLYTVYYFKENSNYTPSIITSVMKRHGINFVMVEWKHDFFFDENIVPQNVLKILKTQMRRINYINGINRNICDGRQIATYIRVSKQIFIDTTKEVNQSIQKVLLPKGLVFDKIKYPLENDIIINEKMILKNKDDFDLIIKEIKKIGINPINIERNRLYLYGNYFVKKLFEIFSFICFQNENDKMIALNHINSLAYSNKKNVLKYKMNLHYCKISTAYYPKVVRDNLSKIFQSFKGFQDIQENVLSIENPYERTYVGFDSVKSLKKSYIKFLHFVDILRYDVFDPKIFYKKKDLKYLIIEGNIDDIDIEDIIPKKIISDIQENCTEFKGNRFAQPYSDFINATFIGFDSNEKLTEAYNLILNYNFKRIKVSKYHEFKTFLSEISDVPEGYLFYDSL